MYSPPNFLDEARGHKAKKQADRALDERIRRVLREELAKRPNR